MCMYKYYIIVHKYVSFIIYQYNHYYCNYFKYLYPNSNKYVSLSLFNIIVFKIKYL